MHATAVELPAEIAVEKFGGKAYWLEWLFEAGLPIPRTLAISAPRGFKCGLSERLEVQRFFGSSGRHKVAIRSSAPSEDQWGSSQAGRFNSFVGEYDVDEVVILLDRVVRSQEALAPHAGYAGVVIQDAVDAAWSGILFSSDPVSFSKDKMTMSFEEGFGGPLMQGEVAGQFLELPRGGKVNELYSGAPEPLRPIIPTLMRYAEACENALHHPVDIEWCVNRGGTVQLVQLRPMTGLPKLRESCVTICNARAPDIPKLVVNDPKIQLRLLCESKGVKVSPAYLAVFNSAAGEVKPSECVIPQQSGQCAAYSVVLLFPKRLSGTVKRLFTKRVESERIVDSLEFLKCQRYSIRAYPKASSIVDALSTIQREAVTQTWLSVFIIQEVFHPIYTGIAQRWGTNVLIDIAYGHFVPKGVVDASHFTVALDGTLISETLATQETRFSIQSGYVFEESIPQEEKLVTPGLSTLRAIVRVLKPLLDAESNVIEFGIASDSTNDEESVYVIDLAADPLSGCYSSSFANTGVLSPGRMVGVVRCVSSSEEALDVHLNDELAVGGEGAETPVIYFCDRASMKYRPLLDRAPPQSLAFVFDSAVYLAHLPILLREKGIPAIIRPSNARLAHGQLVELKAVIDEPGTLRVLND